MILYNRNITSIHKLHTQLWWFWKTLYIWWFFFVFLVWAEICDYIRINILSGILTPEWYVEYIFSDVISGGVNPRSQSCVESTSIQLDGIIQGEGMNPYLKPVIRKFFHWHTCFSDTCRWKLYADNEIILNGKMISLCLLS